jgi:hypothetical protein
VSGGHPGRQEVEKSGGAPVEEGPPTTPDQALDQGDSGSEQRPDSDQAGREPDERGAG